MMHNDECQAMHKIPFITDLACITEKSEINIHQSKGSGTYMQEKVALKNLTTPAFYPNNRLYIEVNTTRLLQEKSFRTYNPVNN